jgi:hypothetical protein
VTRTSKTSLVLGLLAILSLGACADLPQQPATTTSQAAVAPAADEPDLGKSPDQATDQPALASAKDAGAPAVPRTPLVPLAKFPGLSEAQVTGMLGTPQFQRKDAAAELWQYRVDGCVLHLFFYSDKDGQRRVRYAEVRPRTVPGITLEGAAADACLTKLSAAPPAATS